MTTARYLPANCWACGVHVLLPDEAENQGGSFKCGWCSAILETPLPRPLAAGARGVVEVTACHATYSTRQRCLDILRTTVRCGQHGVVALVLFLVSSIYVGGVICVVPHLTHKIWEQVLHWACCTFFAVEVLFNYFACVFTSPGYVGECFVLPSWPDGYPAQKHVFENYRYCYKCHSAKPPGAHHCSICRRCVVDMDHHCPFISNCIGRGNLRVFVLFLSWTLIGCVYAVVACVVLVQRHMEVYDIDERDQVGVWRPFSVLISLMGMVLTSAPMYMKVAMYITLCCLGAGLGITVLFISQLIYISEGSAYITSLQQHSRRRFSCSNLVVNLREVMGGGWPWAWIRLEWRPSEMTLKGVKKLG